MASVDFTQLAVLAELLVGATVVLFTLCSLDDLLVDAYYGLRQLYVALVVRPRHPALRPEQLAAVPEQPIAILVAAPTRTRAVDLDRMLRHTVRTLDYTNYRIFVSMDGDDRVLEAGLAALRSAYRIIEGVRVPASATRPERLNALHGHARRTERRTGVPFQVFVVQEPEDLVHPLALRLYNYLMPRFAMIQTPVLSVPVEAWDLVGGARLDELAVATTREMVVRERLGRNVPSAGAGTAFTRGAADAIALAGGGDLFRTDALAEDYDFGFRLSALGLRSIFARVPITDADGAPDWIATRRRFATSFRDAVSEKSRAILGTALQGWERLGWCGTWRTRYVLFRDRKVLLKAQLAIVADLTVAALAVLLVAGLWTGRTTFVTGASLPAWMVGAVGATVAVLGMHVVVRARAVGRLYGVAQGALSIPRSLVSHVLQFCASWTALGTYLGARFRGELLERESRAPTFVSAERLDEDRARLQTLLVERLFLSSRDLETARAMQRKTGQGLGTVLVELGLAREDDVLEILGSHLRLCVREVDPYTVPAAILARVPRDVALTHGIFPIGEQAGLLQVATDRLVSREDVDRIERTIGGPVEIVLASRRDVAFAMRRRYREEGVPEDRALPLLGERLVRAGVLSPPDLSAALRIQRETFRRVGDVVVEQGWVDRARVEEAAAFARGNATPIGQELRRRGWITEEQLDESLRRQAESDRRLGDILVDHGFLRREQLDQALETFALSA